MAGPQVGANGVQPVHVVAQVRGGDLAQRGDGFGRRLRGERKNAKADGRHDQVTVVFKGADIVALRRVFAGARAKIRSNIKGHDLQDSAVKAGRGIHPETANTSVRILLSNDDGYFAPGLAALERALSPLGTVTVVAPERDRSGASNSLTLDRPLSVRQAPGGFYYVNGTPTDCVHLAVTGLLPELPDIVVSGINDGANMGDDTIYSGTVAAATEGFLLGIPSIAISLVSGEHDHFETAGQVAAELVARFGQHRIDQPVLLNVNVPDVPYEALRGHKVTRLGKRHKAEPVVKAVNPRGDTVYWVGAAGRAQDAGEGTDFHATSAQMVSVTPLQMDLTRFGQMELVGNWLQRPAES